MLSVVKLGGAILLVTDHHRYPLTPGLVKMLRDCFNRMLTFNNMVTVVRDINFVRHHQQIPYLELFGIVLCLTLIRDQITCVLTFYSQDPGQPWWFYLHNSEI